MPAATDRFTVCLNDDVVVQLDDLVCVTDELPDGRMITHYGIVVTQTGYFEGAQWATDTARIAIEHTQPGERVRRVEVQVLRTVPELWVSPHPGAVVRRAAGATRDAALFADQMDERLAIGLDQSGEPVYADWAFISGRQGGHVNITGISGVATKTSYATFLLYNLLETDAGRALLGAHAANTRALVFNAKGEDLLHLDRPNTSPRYDADARARWEALGVAGSGAVQERRHLRPAPAHHDATRSCRTSRAGRSTRSAPTAGRRGSSSAPACCASASPRTTTVARRSASSSSACGSQLVAPRVPAPGRAGRRRAGRAARAAPGSRSSAWSSPRARRAATPTGS